MEKLPVLCLDAFYRCVFSIMQLKRNCVVRTQAELAVFETWKSIYIQLHS